MIPPFNFHFLKQLDHSNIQNAHSDDAQREKVNRGTDSVDMKQMNHCFAAVKAECAKTLQAIVPKEPNKEQSNFTKLDNYNMNKVWDFLILQSVVSPGGNPSARAPSDPGVVTDAVRSVTLQHAVSTQRVRLSRSVMIST